MTCPRQEVGSGRASRRTWSRRNAISSIARLAALAHPFGGRLLGLSSLPLGVGVRIELQPLVAAVRSVMDAMAYVGEPFSDQERAALDAAANDSDAARALTDIQRLLDKRCLLALLINPES